jgi:hypothetical protein
LKAEREGVCKQLLQQYPKGHAFDLGDGTPMVVAKSKSGTHYMAPKNKWAKSGHPPKPPKPPRVPKLKKDKAPKDLEKPLTKKAIVGGKIVDVPIERRSTVPPAMAAVPVVAIPIPPVPAVIPLEIEAVAATPVPERVEPVAPPPVVVSKPEPQKPRDALEEALAALDISDLE